MGDTFKDAGPGERSVYDRTRLPDVRVSPEAMTDTWAAKVLEGVPRFDHCDDGYEARDRGAWVTYGAALAAIARMGEGDGLVDRLLAERIVISTTRTFPSGDERDMVLVPQYGPNPLTTEAAAHIAALTAQVAEAEREAESRSAMFATACEERDAAEAKIATMIEADAVQAMLDAAQPIMAEACRGCEEQIAALTAQLADTQKEHEGWQSAAMKLMEKLSAAEAERDALRERVAGQSQMMDAWRDDLTEAHQEAAALRERVARLEGALRGLHHAVCGETGFAACVRLDSGKAYPWPALDAADDAARAALTDGGKDG